jgi:hypothetical protein
MAMWQDIKMYKTKQAKFIFQQHNIELQQNIRKGLWDTGGEGFKSTPLR